jgi:hypothetical protein
MALLPFCADSVLLLPGKEEAYVAGHSSRVFDHFSLQQGTGDRHALPMRLLKHIVNPAAMSSSQTRGNTWRDTLFCVYRRPLLAAMICSITPSRDFRRGRPLRRTSEAADCRSEPFRPRGPSMAKRSCDRTTGVVLRGTESLLTHRWREMDSNHQFPQARDAFDASAYMRAKRVARAQRVDVIGFS